MLNTIKEVFLVNGFTEDDPDVQNLLSGINGLGSDAIKKMYREFTELKNRRQRKMDESYD